MAVDISNTIVTGIPDVSLLKILIHRKENCFIVLTHFPQTFLYMRAIQKVTSSEQLTKQGMRKKKFYYVQKICT
jgi:hypothetical protein